MTNPTLEQRARELFEIARPNFHYAKRGSADGGAFEQSEIGRCLMNAMKAIASSPTFSHTGVEQAIEACAKVAEEHAASLKPRAKADPKGEFVCGEMYAGVVIATKIRSLPDTSPLPAQSPDDIAYAGAVPSPVNVEGLVGALRPFSMALGTVAPDDFERWPDGMTIEFEGFCEYITVGDLRRARKALASLSPDGER